MKATKCWDSGALDDTAKSFILVELLVFPQILGPIIGLCNEEPQWHSRPSGRQTASPASAVTTTTFAVYTYTRVSSFKTDSTHLCFFCAHSKEKSRDVPVLSSSQYGRHPLPHLYQSRRQFARVACTRAEFYMKNGIIWNLEEGYGAVAPIWRRLWNKCWIINQCCSVCI